MNDRAAQLSAKGPNPDVEVIIGQAAFGKYRLILWDETGRNPKIIQESTNVDNIPDKLPIGGSAKSLNKKIVSWEANIAAYPNAPGQLFSMIVEISQGGVVVPHGETKTTGTLEGGARLVFGAVRLSAV